MQQAISRPFPQLDPEGATTSFKTRDRRCLVADVEPENCVVSCFVLLDVAAHELSLTGSSKANQRERMYQCFAAARLLHLEGNLCRNGGTVDVSV